MSKIKNDGLGQYGTEPFERQQFETAGVKAVKFWVKDEAKFVQTQQDDVELWTYLCKRRLQIVLKYTHLCL